MPDPDPTSSNIRCEQSFSSNSTTSPVSLLGYRCHRTNGLNQTRIGRRTPTSSRVTLPTCAWGTKAVCSIFVSSVNNEFVKAHRVAVARSGLASYWGKVIRDSSQTAGPLAFERRKKHVLARMGWMQALLRRCGRESIDLYRMESCDGPLQPRRRETALVSASLRMDIVQEMSGWADSQRTVALYRQAVPVERVFMTYLETEAMNQPFREAEAVLLADPSNQAF